MRGAIAAVVLLASCSFKHGTPSGEQLDDAGVIDTIDAAPPRYWKAVTAGDEWTCGIQMDDTLWCWGDNGDLQLGNGTTGGQAVEPQQIGTATWTWISADAEHTCGVQTDGTLWCWGNNQYGQLGDGTTTSNPSPVLVTGTSWASVDAGTFHTCALRTDNTLWCWGFGGAGDLGNGAFASSSVPVQVTGAWSQVSVGRQVTCARKDDSTLWCWGHNGEGTVGDGTVSARGTPVSIGTETFIDISVTSFHACGIRSDGTMRCWGDDTSGQLGNGTAGPARAPTPLAGADLTGWLDVEAGDDHTCAHRGENEVWCWGRDSQGQIAASTTRVPSYDSPTQTAMGLDLAKLAPGRMHTCALAADGQMYCTGSDANGALGTGLGGRRNTPTVLPGAWMDISAGGATTCGLRDSTSALECWGANGSGQLGDGNFVPQPSPTPVAVAAARTHVSVGRSHVCDVRASGETTCWGGNEYGQLGGSAGGAGAASTTPVIVSTQALKWHSSSDHVCGITTATQAGAVCWGRNDAGQTGNGGGAPPATPFVVYDGFTVPSVATGALHTCMTFPSDNSLYCWGNNDEGQLGINSTVSTVTGAPVAGTWGDVFAGQAHTCARYYLTQQLYCWGNNEFGQVGNNATADELVPVAIGTAAWLDIALGDDHTCGIQSDRSLWCWGRNRDGQLGDGTFTSSSVPVRVGTAADWDSVTAGRDHTCARKQDATSWCWGRNRDGQTGDGTAIRAAWTVVD